MKLAEWAAKALLPPQVFAVKNYDSPENPSGDTKCLLFKLMSIVGLKFLSLLHDLFPIILRRSTPEIIMCLASFSDLRDIWVRPDCAEIAGRSLKTFINTDASLAMNVIADLLRTRILSAFKASRSVRITQAGHKALTPLGDSYSSHEDKAQIKSWKYEQVYIPSVLRWLLQNLDASLPICLQINCLLILGQAPNIETQWSYVTPPVLTLVDDESVYYKIMGCELLQIVLNGTPSTLLKRTGLGDVFMEALMPCLSYLPNLTPENESITLLGSVYPTLHILCRCLYSEPSQRRNMNVLLDRILRAGVLNGLAHAGEHVSLSMLLVGELSKLVDDMGVWSVKHLKVSSNCKNQA